MEGSLSLFQEAPSDTWSVGTRDRATESLLCRELKVSPLVAACLIAAGYTDPTAADLFLKAPLDGLSDPSLLPDYEDARDAILGAVERREKIYVHGDYDVDGVSSAAILTRFLRKLGADVEVHVPHRIREGYGIHMLAVEQAKQCGAKLFLTCDCGTAAIPQIEAARAAGMRVVVTDHHEPKPDLPPVPVVNPHREGSRYPFPMLCGAGVAFQLCAGITRDKGWPVDKFYRGYLDLVTLGTVADIMPLVGENRILVKNGLPRLWETKKVGLQRLIRLSVKSDAKRLVARDVGFGLGPRLNAAGRIADSELALRLLLTGDDREATEIADLLDRLNTERKEEEARTVDEAIEMVESNGLLQNPVLVVAGEGWHPGIIGLVAGKLQKKYNRPSFAIGYDPESGVMKGSARSVPGFHLADAIHALRHLVQGGGHELAAGMSGSAAVLEEFQRSLQNYATEVAGYVPTKPTLSVCAEVAADEADVRAAQELDRLAPFGEGNREPIFVTRNMRLVNCQDLGEKQKHARLTLEDDNGVRRCAKGWDYWPTCSSVPLGSRVDVAYRLEINEFRGNSSLEWSLQGFSLSRG